MCERERLDSTTQLFGVVCDWIIVAGELSLQQPHVGRVLGCLSFAHWILIFFFWDRNRWLSGRTLAYRQTFDNLSCPTNRRVARMSTIRLCTVTGSESRAQIVIKGNITLSIKWKIKNLKIHAHFGIIRKDCNWAHLNWKPKCVCTTWERLVSR